MICKIMKRHQKINIIDKNYIFDSDIETIKLNAHKMYEIICI